MTSSSEGWVLLAYRIPREPSTPRIGVWRKLRRLGAAQLLDGLVALPSDARSKEHLEWIAQDVEDAGGEASLWIARPASKAQEARLIDRMAAAVEAECDELVAAAEDALGEAVGARKRTLGRLRRELKRVSKRDYFPTGGIERARVALDRLSMSVDDTQKARS